MFQINYLQVINLQIPITRECGLDDICITDVQLYMAPIFPPERNYLVFGQRERLTISVEVINRGEPAYEAQLFVVHDTDLYFVRAEGVSCHSSEGAVNATSSLLQCDVGNPLAANSVKGMNLVFDPTNLDYSITVVVISTYLTTHSIEVNSSALNNNDTLFIPLQNDAQVTFTGYVLYM